MLNIKGMASQAIQLARQKTAKVLDDLTPNLGTGKITAIGTDIVEIAKNSLGNDGLLSAAKLNAFDSIDYGYDWAGLTKEEITAHYKDLKALGIQRKQHYVVRFTPYKNNLTKHLAIVENPLMGWLATDVSVPILQLETESKKIGNHTVNYVTGQSPLEFTISMIETVNNDVARSLSGIGKLACRIDGTQNPPASYAFWVDIILYDRKTGVNAPKISKRVLCYASQATMDLSSAEDGALIIPITFTQARGFMSF